MKLAGQKCSGDRCDHYLANVNGVAACIRCDAVNQWPVQHKKAKKK